MLSFSVIMYGLFVSAAYHVARSRKRGTFPQISYCELDLSVNSAKSIAHTRENCLMLACRILKLQSFEFHTRAYLGFEISAFTYSKVPGVSVYYVSRCMYTMSGRLLLRNRAAADDHDGSPSHLC